MKACLRLTMAWTVKTKNKGKNSYNRSQLEGNKKKKSIVYERNLHSHFSLGNDEKLFHRLVTDVCLQCIISLKYAQLRLNIKFTHKENHLFEIIHFFFVFPDCFLATN